MITIRFIDNSVFEAMVNDDLLFTDTPIWASSFPGYEVEAMMASNTTTIEEAAIVYAWSNEALPEAAKNKTTILWDDVILHPTLEWWTELYAQGRLGEAVPEYAFLAFEQELVSEMLANVLKFGTLNGVAYDAPTFEVLAHIALMQMSSQEKFTAVQSWHQREGRDIQSIAWLFQPMETAHLGPISKVKRQERAAFGIVNIVDGLFKFWPVARPEIGKQADILFSQKRIALALQDKGAYASRGGVHVRQDGMIVVPVGDTKKGQQREVLAAGTSTLVEAPASSFLMREMADGSILPVAQGTKQAVALTSAMASMPLSGGIYIRPTHSVDVIEQRTFNIQVLRKQNVDVWAGMEVKPGESIIGVEGIGIYDLNWPAVVASVSRVTNDKVSDTVTVKLHIRVRSEEPKVRSGGGIKGSCHKAITKGVVGTLDQLGVDILMGVEALKGNLPLLQLCADTTERTIVVRKDGTISDDDQAFFNGWLESAKQTITMRAPATLNMRRFIVAAGHESRTELVEAWVGSMVLEVETPVTELRAVRTAPTLLAWLDLARRYGTNFEATPQRTYDLRNVPILSMKDAQEAMEMAWADALGFLAEKYPAGCRITNNGSDIVGLGNGSVATIVDVTSYVDFVALKGFTAGRISGDDAMSIALSESLQNKVQLGNVFKLYKEQMIDYRQLCVAADQLGRSLNFFNAAARGFILGGKLLRDITRPAEKSALLTARAYNHIPEREVWVAPATAEAFGLVDGDIYHVARFPGASALPMFLKVKAGLAYGTAVVNSYSMQIGNSGDVDGDQVYLTAHKAIGTLFAINWRKRDIAMRIITMVAANNGVFFADNGVTEPVVSGWKVKRVDFNASYAKAEAKYLKHSTIEESGLAGFLAPTNMVKKIAWVNGKSGLMDLNSLKPKKSTVGPYDALIQFGTKGVGAGYSVMFNLGIIEQVLPNEQITSARDLGGALYEDVFLAGYKATKWPLFEAIQATEAKDAQERQGRITKLALALKEAGFNVTMSDVVAVYTARAMHANFGKNVPSAALVASKFDWNPVTPLVQAFRALTSGMPSMLIDQGQWQYIGQFIPANSPLRQVYDSIGEIVAAFSTTLEVQAENEEELADDGFDF